MLWRELFNRDLEHVEENEGNDCYLNVILKDFVLDDYEEKMKSWKGHYIRKKQAVDEANRKKYANEEPPEFDIDSAFLGNN